MADGACFLCTNQGGIRSLTDMSPMTPGLFTLIIHPQRGECCQGWADRGEEGETEAGERERSLTVLVITLKYC